MAVPDPTWREYTLAAPRFVPRKNRTVQSMTLCGKNIYILGGLQDGYPTATPLYILDFATQNWSQAKFPHNFFPGAVPSLYGHTGTLVDDRVIFVGGIFGLEEEHPQKKIFAFDIVLREFAYIKTYGVKREGGVVWHSAHYLYETNEIVVLGGQDEQGTHYKDPLLSLDVQTFAWARIRWTGKLPPARALHGSCLVGRKIYIYGGIGPNNLVYDDMYILDMTNRLRSFSQLELRWIPTRRFGTTLLYLHGQLYMFGGKTSNVDVDQTNTNIRLHDLWRFSLQEQAWYECESFNGRKHPRRNRQPCGRFAEEQNACIRRNEGKLT